MFTSGYILINLFIQSYQDQLLQSTRQEVETLAKMFDREKDLKQEKAEINMRIAKMLFDKSNLQITNNKRLYEITNQQTKSTHSINISEWVLNGEIMPGSNSWVDSVKTLVGGTATIFQRTDSGYVRISTNVMNSKGERALFTYIPNNSNVIKVIESNKPYYGRAYVVNDRYITAYRPIYEKGSIVGMYYVGYKEKNLEQLKSIISKIKIGETGFPFVFDKTGKAIVSPEKGTCTMQSNLFEKMKLQNNELIKYSCKNNERIAVFTYYQPFQLYVGISIDVSQETKPIIRKTTLASLIIVLLALVIISAIIYFLAAERISRYFRQLEFAGKKLKNVSKALAQSEDRFRKLFNSTGDAIFVTDSTEKIIEVNHAAIQSLGYSNKELLGMKMHEIKSLKYVDKVPLNRDIIYEKGIYTFESEHQTKDNRVIPVEITSRLVDYKNRKLILSVVRDINERKAIERQVLSSVIKAEEKERGRIAKEMHDGLGPILSTIKLYVNELKYESLKGDERLEYVNNSNDLLDEAVTSVRAISNNLMPTVIQKYGLIKALDSLCNKINNVGKIKINFIHQNIPNSIDADLKLILFRISGELINNTLKHAKAKVINLYIKQTENKIILDFKDDGIGFDVDKIMNIENKGMGLKNIISRIKSIDGYYKFESVPGEGFRIKIEIVL